MKNDYLNLLAKRESKEMLGRNYSNMWILIAVLTVTLIAVAFSYAGKKYLESKMTDPFTNWVNIKNDFGKGNFQYLFEALESDSIRTKYQIESVTGDDYRYGDLRFYDSNGNIQESMEGRFLGDFGGKLTEAVLDKEHVINGCSVPVGSIGPASLGLIITEKALKRLGYTSDNIPAFINLDIHIPEEIKNGLESIYTDGEMRLPMPLLGVVKSLPMNMDVIGSHYWYEQNHEINPRHTFEVYQDKYYKRDKLYYFVTKGEDSLFYKNIYSIPRGSERSPGIFKIDEEDYANHNFDNLRSWKAGSIYQVIYGTNRTSVAERARFDKYVQDAFPNGEVFRIFEFDTYDNSPNSDFGYYSVNFKDLKSIMEFAEFAKKDPYRVQIELSQVISKRNFSAVSTIAIILTIVMLMFAIVCIVLFIINMLQSYFQKVKRNLGTFKAFGMGTKSLIGVYVSTMLIMVLSAVVASIFITGLISLMLRLFNCYWEEGFPVLKVFNPFMYFSVIIVLLSTFITVRVVMSRLLHKTPGDLIYDR